MMNDLVKPAVRKFLFFAGRRLKIRRQLFLSLSLVSLLMLVNTISGQILYQMTHLNVQFVDGGLQYSPNGSRIAICYRWFPGDVGHMALLDQSGVPLNITWPDLPDSGVHSFCWEPNGEYFIMSMRRSQVHYSDLYRGWIYGGQLENITNTPNQSEYWPKYSHNGDWMVYSVGVSTAQGTSMWIRNMQTGQDSILYSWSPASCGEYSWCHNDTAISVEVTFSPAIQSQIYYFYGIPNGHLNPYWVGGEPSWAPYGRDIIFNKTYTDSVTGVPQDSSDLWVYLDEFELGVHNPLNVTGGYDEIWGLKSDPDWYPSTSVNAFIFLKKRRIAGVLRGDVWMIWDIDLSVPKAPEVVPFRYQVGQAYPNPFNAIATIPLQLERSMPVRWELFNILGQRILQESPGMLTPGFHRIVVDGESMASGNYWIVVYLGERAGTKEAEVRSLVLIK